MKNKKNSIIKDLSYDDTYLSTCCPHIEIEKNSLATVEGCMGILQYDCNEVKINCNNLTVRFTGENLQIDNLNGRRICVRGNIVSVDFSN